MCPPIVTEESALNEQPVVDRQGLTRDEAAAELANELYPVRHSAVYPDVAELAGCDALAQRARVRLEAGQPVEAIHLAEMALAGSPTHEGASRVMLDAHQRLIADGGDVSFWEDGWLEHQVQQWRTGP